jgi:nucleoside-diphosphate-sugar epimerase
MKLLVTGASGFIGRNLLLHLPPSWAVTAIYHRSEDFPAFLAAHGLAQVRPLRVDLRCGEAVAAALRPQADWEAICFLAANGDPAVSVERPAFDLASNTSSLLNLLEVCRAGHLVYFSSGAVYDGLEGPVGPQMRVEPRLPYALSKLASEGYLRFFRQRARRLERCTVLRFFGAFGPREPARKLYTRLVRAFALNRETRFAIRGDGTNLIDAMYIDDAIAALLKVLGHPSAEGTYDLGPGAPLTIEALVRRAAACFGAEQVQVERQGHTEEPIRFWMDPGPFARQFGFAPAVALEEGLQRLAGHLRWGNR